MLKRFFLVILFLLFACNAMAATYYVKTGGDDTAAGTSDGTAWAHCPGQDGWTGSATLSPRDIIYFREGDTWTSSASPILTATSGVTYYGLGYGTAGTRAKFVSSSTASGTPTHGLIDIDVNTVNVSSFDLDGDNKSIGGIYIGFNCEDNFSGVTVHDCIVHNIGPLEETDPITYIYGIIVGQRSLKTTSNITITNCQVYDVAHEGIPIYPSSNILDVVENVTVRGCTIYNTGVTGGATYGHGIYITGNVSGATVEFNTIHDSPAAALSTATKEYGYSIGAPINVTIRYNLIHTSVYGIHFGPHVTDAIDGVYVYGNVLYNTFLYLGGGNYFSKSIGIYNNTIYTTTLNQKGIWLYKTSTNVGGISIKNNIIQTGSGTAAICLDDEGGLLAASQHTNNLYYRASGNLVLYGTGNFYTSANLIANFEASAQVTNPTFTGGDLPTGFSGTYGTDMIPNQTYFSLQAGSPALGNGAVLSSTYSKAINNAGTSDSAKTRGTAWDIGAYEYTLENASTAKRSIFRIGGRNRVYYQP